MKHVLSIEQILHLKELGLDTSDGSMCFEWNESDSDNMVVTSLDADTNYDYCRTTYTLQDIFDKLPRYINVFCITYKLCVEPLFAGPWAISYQKSMSEPFIVKVSGNLLDAAYEMLCWCIENRYIKTKE